MHALVAVAMLALAGCDALLQLQPITSGSGTGAFDAGVTDGLIAWYPMDSLAAGACAHDATGHGHEGTCVGVVTAVPGVFDHAFMFGGNASIDVPHANDLDTLSAFTIGVWFEIDSAPATEGCLVARPSEIGYSQLLSITGDGSIHYAISDADATITPGPTFGTWHHLALRWDASARTVSAWADGKLSGSTLGINDTFIFSDLWIGGIGSSGPPAMPYAGKMDDVRIFNRALSDVEMTELAKR
jgi:hypothetical protein